MGDKFFRKNKGGQVTIFIIIAVVVVVLGILIYMFYPQIKTTFSYEEQNPSSFMQTCIEEKIEKTVETLSLQGGSIEPNNYIVYMNNRIEYLCYTGEYYKTCVMQQPMLKEHIESEIKNEISEEVKNCFDSMEESYKKSGYGVNLKQGETKIELLPKKVIVTFDSQMTLTKGETKTYDSFRVVINNNLYELVSITNSILNWEASYGDAETTAYMDYYPNLKVEKQKQSEGSTIYILTERDSENKFQFASRSVAWPPGYGAS